MSDDDRIPAAETYLGIEIHDQQSPERVRQVKIELDRVFGITTAEELASYAADVTRAPEARLLASAKCAALFQICADERRNRPSVDLTEVKGSVAGLAVQRWRSPWAYCSLLDVWPPGAPGPVRREQPLEPKSYVRP